VCDVIPCTCILRAAPSGAELGEILVGSSRGVATCGVVRACTFQEREHCASGGVRRQNVAREAYGGFESLLASRLRPLSSTATHPPNCRSLHGLWAQLSLVVTVVFPAVAGETTSLGSRCVPASGGRVLLPTSLVWRCATPRLSTWQTTAAKAARGLRGWMTTTRCGQRISVRRSRRKSSWRRS